MEHLKGSIPGRQKLVGYLYISFLLIVGICCNLGGITGPQSPVFVWLNSTHLGLTVLLLIGLLIKRISLVTVLNVITVATQLEISAEMIHCALVLCEYHRMLIVCNMVLSGILVMFSLVLYIKYIPYLLSAMSIGTYMICILLTKSAILLNFYPLLILVCIVICLLGNRLIQNIRHPEAENSTLIRDEKELLHFLDINKEEIGVFIALSRNESDNWQKAGELFDKLGEECRRSIMDNIAALQLQQETEMATITRLFPMLTPSEQEICRLILQGKKLGEICTILGKTETNINSTRAHIRKKLGLKPSDNLHNSLQERKKIGCE